MKAIKVALIGNGHDHAPWNYYAIKRHPEIFDLIGVCDLIPGKDEKIYAGEKRFSLEELLENDLLDAVIIESGKESEVYYAQKFALRAVPVFLDKPGSSNYDEYEKLLAIVKEKNLPFGLGYVYRFNPMVKKALEMQKNGMLGSVFSVEAQMSVYHNKTKRQWLKKYKGGMMFYLGCHLIDAVCMFKGFPEEIIPLNACSGNDGIDCEDIGCAVLKYSDGPSFIKACASEVNGYARRQIVVTGTRGTVEISPPEEHCESDGGEEDLVARAVITLGSSDNKQWGNSGVKEVSEPFARYAPMLIQFARQVRGEEGYVMPLDYELKLMRTVVAACGAENETYRGR